WRRVEIRAPPRENKHVALTERSSCASASITAAPAWTWTCPTTAWSARSPSAPRRRWPIPTGPSPTRWRTPSPAARSPTSRPPARAAPRAPNPPAPPRRAPPGRGPPPLTLPPLPRPPEGQGIARRDILILVATGLHRPNEGAELEELVGPETVANYRVENHHG